MGGAASKPSTGGNTAPAPILPSKLHLSDTDSAWRLHSKSALVGGGLPAVDLALTEFVTSVPELRLLIFEYSVQSYHLAAAVKDDLMLWSMSSRVIPPPRRSTDPEEAKRQAEAAASAIRNFALASNPFAVRGKATSTIPRLEKVIKHGGGGYRGYETVVKEARIGSWGVVWSPTEPVLLVAPNDDPPQRLLAYTPVPPPEQPETAAATAVDGKTAAAPAVVGLDDPPTAAAPAVGVSKFESRLWGLRGVRTYSSRAVDATFNKRLMPLPDGIHVAACLESNIVLLRLNHTPAAATAVVASDATSVDLIWTLDPKQFIDPNPHPKSTDPPEWARFDCIECLDSGTVLVVAGRTRRLVFIDMLTRKTHCALTLPVPAGAVVAEDVTWSMAPDKGMIQHMCTYPQQTILFATSTNVDARTEYLWMIDYRHQMVLRAVDLKPFTKQLLRVQSMLVLPRKQLLLVFGVSAILVFDLRWANQADNKFSTPASSSAATAAAAAAPVPVTFIQPPPPPNQPALTLLYRHTVTRLAVTDPSAVQTLPDLAESIAVATTVGIEMWSVSRTEITPAVDETSQPRVWRVPIAADERVKLAVRIDW